MKSLVNHQKRCLFSGGTRSTHSETQVESKLPVADIETLMHNLQRLKISYSKSDEENTRLKTKNTQLETLVQSLNEDLNSQLVEIQKIYEGKSPRPHFLD